MRFVAILLALPLLLLHVAATAQDVTVGQPSNAELTAVEAWEADPSAALDAAGVGRDDFLWVARPVVVFADTPNDPAFIEQMELLAARPEALVERDVVVITDTDPEARNALRQALRPRGFMLVLIGKDGQVEIRKPLPWSVRELTRSIDKMPMRQQELRDGGRLRG